MITYLVNNLQFRNLMQRYKTAALSIVGSYFIFKSLKRLIGKFDKTYKGYQQLTTMRHMPNLVMSQKVTVKLN